MAQTSFRGSNATVAALAGIQILLLPTSMEAGTTPNKLRVGLNTHTHREKHICKAMLHCKCTSTKANQGGKLTLPFKSCSERQILKFTSCFYLFNQPNMNFRCGKNVQMLTGYMPCVTGSVTKTRPSLPKVTRTWLVAAVNFQPCFLCVCVNTKCLHVL